MTVSDLFNYTAATSQLLEIRQFRLLIITGTRFKKLKSSNWLKLMKIGGYCSSENVKYLDFFSQLYFYCELSNRTALMVAVLPYNLRQKKVHLKTLCDIFCFIFHQQENKIF